MIKKIFVLLVTFFVSTNTLFAATLNLSPSSGTHNQNATFSVGIYVASPDQAMNAASATIKFPTDKLQVVSVSKSGSIVNFWAQEPTFSNSSGEIKLEGVVLTPGYQGSSGKILTINFKGKSVGTAGISISSSSVLANDGIGTNILKGVSGASFIIKEATAKEESKPVDVKEGPTIKESLPPKTACTTESILTLPELTDYHTEITAGETLVIKGKVLANANVESRITNKKKDFLISQELESTNGRFVLEQTDLKPGTIFISFRAFDGCNPASDWSEPLEVHVRGGSVLGFDSIMSSPGTIGIFLLLLLIAILTTRTLTKRNLRKTRSETITNKKTKPKNNFKRTINSVINKKSS